MPTAGDASITDADQRDLMLSCGAALHHLRIGLAAAGVAASVYRMPSAAKSDLVASIVLGRTAPIELTQPSATGYRFPGPTGGPSAHGRCRRRFNAS